MTDTAAALARIAGSLRADGGVDPADAPGAKRRFGAGALKTGGKIFAMVSNGAVVLKLPAARVAALVAEGRGAAYDPGSGRTMREWVALAGPERGWLPLAREARDFVRGAR